MVSSISVLHCTLVFINLARLFHHFQNVEWFALRWMICSYDAECILTTRFRIRWVICTKLNVFWLRWIICTVAEWFKRFNETYSWEISPRRLSWKFLSHENPSNEHCPQENPLVKIPPVKIAPHQIKKQAIFNI